MVIWHPGSCPLPSAFSDPRRRRNLISLTPLIDVVFILLIFFMLVSNFMDWRAIVLSATQAAGSTREAQLLPIVVDLDHRGARVTDQVLAPQALIDHIAAELDRAPQRPVLVRPDAGVVVQEVVTLLDRMSLGGIQGISLIPAQPDQQRATATPTGGAQ